MAEGAASYWDVFLQALGPAAGERILDVGAGNGMKAAKVMRSSSGAEIFAIDPNEKRITIAARDYPTVKSSVARAENLPFPDSYFDKVYTMMALHHYSDLDKSLAEIARVLKHGGSFVVLEVEPSSLPGRLYRLVSRAMGEHLNFMTMASLRAMLESTGTFRAERSIPMGSKYLIQLLRN